MANKVKRKVLAQFISSHLHIECVEVEADIWQIDSNVTVAELDKVEAAARQKLQEVAFDGYGPFKDKAAAFDLLGVLVAQLTGLDRGRITWVRQVPVETIVRPKLEMA